MHTPSKQPTPYIPHGGGPCFFMDDPKGVLAGMQRFLESMPAQLPATPNAILGPGHWETEGFSLTGASSPPLLFDYYGFPAQTYQLRYDAPGDPVLAGNAAALLQPADLDAQIDAERGFDHGVFIPLKVAFSDASIPVVEMSVDRDLDPAFHLAAGRALAPLRDDGVLILATGMSFHNMRGYGGPRFTEPSEQFDARLTATLAADPATRSAGLRLWQDAPAARVSHPEEEYLIPLMIAAGAAEGRSDKIYSECVLSTAISGFRFN